MDRWNQTERNGLIVAKVSFPLTKERKVPTFLLTVGHFDGGASCGWDGGGARSGLVGSRRGVATAHQLVDHQTNVGEGVAIAARHFWNHVPNQVVQSIRRASFLKEDGAPQTKTFFRIVCKSIPFREIGVKLFSLRYWAINHICTLYVAASWKGRVTPFQLVYKLE